MPYDRDSRYDREGEYHGSNRSDYSQPYGSGRESGYSSAREYQSAGRDGGRGDYGRDRTDYGSRDQYREQYGRGQRDYGQDRSYQQEGREREQVRGREYGQSQGNNHDDRGFLDRAGDEVRSWFGDEDAERRRDMDQRYAERSGQTGRSRHDDDYHNWRSGQMQALDRDYDEYRRENRSRFEKEFSDWRSNRQTQRQTLNKATEHQEVVGSDGQHVGTVDKIKGDRIMLTKTDKDAGGRHHSVPCNWITSVDDKVTLNKTADEAKQAWRDEERGALFGGGDRNGDDGSTDRNPNRTFSGTY